MRLQGLLKKPPFSTISKSESPKLAASKREYIQPKSQADHEAPGIGETARGFQVELGCAGLTSGRWGSEVHKAGSQSWALVLPHTLKK